MNPSIELCFRPRDDTALSGLKITLDSHASFGVIKKIRSYRAERSYESRNTWLVTEVCREVVKEAAGNFIVSVLEAN